MRVSEAQTTAKKTLMLNEIAGVDLTSAPLSVKPTRASYMKNMINKGGVNYKRNGFVQAAQFFDKDGNCQKINGIYPCKFKDSWEETREVKIIHAGQRIYLCEDDFSRIEIKLGENVELKNEKEAAVARNTFEAMLDVIARKDVGYQTKVQSIYEVPL